MSSGALKHLLSPMDADEPKRSYEEESYHHATNDPQQRMKLPSIHNVFPTLSPPSSWSYHHHHEHVSYQQLPPSSSSTQYTAVPTDNCTASDGPPRNNGHLDFLLSNPPTSNTTPAGALPAPPVKRGRGRPRKTQLNATSATSVSSNSPVPSAGGAWSLSITLPREKGPNTPPTNSGLAVPVKRSRGRPRKIRSDDAPATPQKIISNRALARVQQKLRTSPRLVLKGHENSGRGARERKTTTIFSPTDKPKRKKLRTQRGVMPSARKPDSDNPHVNRIVARVRNRLSNMRVYVAFQEAYEVDGWRGGETIKPTAELISVRNKLAHSKRVMVRDLREFDALFAADKPLPKDASELADDEIICSKCGSTETSDGNDIVLCDCSPCHRAYHQQCLEPVLMELPNEEDEWYCPRCDGVFKCLVLINSTFAETWETLDEIFPDLKQTADTAANADAADSDESDEDFDANEIDNDNDDEDASAESDDDDAHALSESEVQYHQKTTVVLDVSRRSQARDGSADEDENDDDDPAKLIVHGKRKRAVVDYRKLHGEMFPQGEDDEDEDKEYVPAVTAEDDDRDDNGDDNGDEDDDPAKLIVHGKRKRPAVDYRKLHGEMFPQGDEDEADDKEYVPAVDATAAAASDPSASEDDEECA
ncbi:Aste57867_433 [Aphanomyces stellatus]|uniref:Aste57867_433 protein n=1 Tax=Aphanomyces stellatus TaxID=120398 RepID=A0A485K5R0_9STRA|nr:hypothetical protein As57867_000432 [Aphanomyces stellatus]VFT77658.1 Aste57867_433 [Aphanomyces stellatus]